MVQPDIIKIFKKSLVEYDGYDSWFDWLQLAWFLHPGSRSSYLNRARRWLNFVSPYWCSIMLKSNGRVNRTISQQSGLFNCKHLYVWERRSIISQNRVGALYFSPDHLKLRPRLNFSHNINRDLRIKGEVINKAWWNQQASRTQAI